jgi:lactobin A/cerein 7B family class IIb bacteriocin
MRELTMEELNLVDGGIAPAVYGALYLGGRTAARAWT